MPLLRRGHDGELDFPAIRAHLASMPDVRSTDRQNRLRAALRENLKRRKQQAKGRAGGLVDEPAPPTTEGDQEHAGQEEDEAKSSA
ncbi:hypothetical protein [Bradyrhizobium sp. LHD-71]|uniref:hypothetical protein n=1 Tax=Bradyrhizobium sp. LHD-71 TaxID=3072141 RepID=UPI00280F6FDA|nr:hypothetical protein [Bradyrhizobium sp. LHD-71]MDQ8732475.1 hypothetical protein [Bradyrhizobium sp. LHD-71]